METSVHTLCTPCRFLAGLLAHSPSAMSLHTPPQPAEHTSVQLEGGAINAAAMDPAAAAAAAALVALPQPVAEAGECACMDGGMSTRVYWRHSCYVMPWCPLRAVQQLFRLSHHVRPRA